MKHDTDRIQQSFAGGGSASVSASVSGAGRGGATRRRERIVLTGVKPTGALHLGNYIGAIKPSLRLAQNPPPAAARPATDRISADRIAADRISEARLVANRTPTESDPTGAELKGRQAQNPPSGAARAAESRGASVTRPVGTSPFEKPSEGGAELACKGFFFIADGHSLASFQEAKTLRRHSREAAAAWLACGLDPKQSLFYLQSDIPEIFELSWILACVAPKGLMNRAHSYKAARDQNENTAQKKDLDKGVSMGLFSYPVLMAADILLFQADEVPVGRDQLQHLEMTRDIAQKFNRAFKTDLLKPPRALSFADGSLPGLDGRKMSKSHNNCISLFSSPKELKKSVMRIKTDSLPAGAPKDPENSLIFDIYKAFAHAEETSDLKKRFREGISYGEAKEILFEKLNDFLQDKREIYRHYMEANGETERIWKEGRERARAEVQPFMRKIKEAAGLSAPAKKAPSGDGGAAEKPLTEKPPPIPPARNQRD